MTIYNQIMEIANCNLETAKAIRNAIDNDWALDWSECTNAKFLKVVKLYASKIA